MHTVTEEKIGVFVRFRAPLQWGFNTAGTAFGWLVWTSKLRLILLVAAHRFTSSCLK
jgi:hypothetical protein